MRKRLFIFAAATCFALSAFATPAFAGEPSLPDEPTISSEASEQSEGNSNGNSDGNSDGNPDGNPDGNVKEDALHSGSDDALPDEESHSDEEPANAGVAAPAPVVAKIGDTTYTTLQDAITAACNGTTSSDATITITLQRDLELNNEGLRFDGPKVSTPAEWKDITLNADNHSLTLNDKGIYGTNCKVTIKNCPTLTVHAGTSPEGLAAVFFSPGTLILDECDTVNITNLTPNTSGGNGLCIYNGGDLYIQNNTHFTVSGFMNPGQAGEDGCSGIYIDSDTDENHNNNYQKIMSQIVVSNNSTLTATNCFHNGITANPANINVKGQSVLTICDNNTPYTYGTGGLGCYFGKLTVAGGSSVVSTGNTGWGYGIFVGGLEVDGDSNVDVSNNGSICNVDTIYTYWDGTGLAISRSAVLHSGATVTSHDNWGIGIQLYSEGNDRYPGGPLTVESGATLSSTHNGNYGMANACTLTVKSGAHVCINENIKGGLDNYPGATTTVEKDADFVIENNFGRGIKNGNADQTDKPGKLVIESGLITENHTEGKTPSFQGVDLSKFPDGYYYWGGGNYYNIGGGIYNECGIVSLSTAAKVYNNHAKVAGDDLYNNDVEGNSFDISALEPGAKWCVLDDDRKIIDDWYHDDEGDDKRWKETNARNNTDTVLPQGAALKAAHGINAPTPSPKPVEPTAAPTEAPTPTAAPTTVPTVARTAAPTPAPADNTATAAPATPAPTARPTVTATPAPTAQASGVIPQTGDSSSPALFSILTLGSITALCVLQKRRKSK